ncbi:predicted N-acetyltransferase YhbS [Rhizobium subbaraonis]|uniref:Predicted N-acetyltransferase YhbS n=1 Tax=Rhizobium subbaraonis TaxID=908946 RepID=A0A285UGI7_9HYPH|nr:GNAT family N-acetyltransferase [Rhizobium subbaraonis]SOC41000.1 predicted N-acetyltransferase YhbS [Rhizobium subbaraonis]
MQVRRLEPSFGRYDELLAMIRAAFAYMDARIDPPSSAQRLTPATLKEKALSEIVFLAVDDQRLVGCIFCRPEPQRLYIGKLAVVPDRQGDGIGRALLMAAEAEARRLSLPAMRLETRIELTENHARFHAMGFEKTAENRHLGFDRTTSIEMTKHL